MGYGEVPDLDSKAIAERLLAADADFAETFGTSPQWRTVVVGGAPLILLGLISRMTPDIDIASGPQKMDELFARHDINFRAGGTNGFPYDFEDRLVPMGFRTRVLDYQMASLEDIVASKLNAYRPKDVEDITSPAVLERLDWGLLAGLGQELENAGNSPRARGEWEEMYRRYREEYGPRA